MADMQPLALIMCPSRELALQIYNEAMRLVYGLSVHVGVQHGGTDTAVMSKCQQGIGTVDLLVGTPGRLRALVDDGLVSLSFVRCFVLDDADRLLWDDFIDDIDWLNNVSTAQARSHRIKCSLCRR
jgi:superfamily II DNA/RNA helicase